MYRPSKTHHASHNATAPYSTSRLTRGGTTKSGEGSSKVDPSFKSKRYRDKLREQIKSLEALLPIDKSNLHRKVDSQTVFRLVISYFRTKIFFQAAGLSPLLSSEGNKDKNDSTPDTSPGAPQTPSLDDSPTNEGKQKLDVAKDINNSMQGQLLLQALDGFLFILTSDGTILYTSENIATHLGFNQVDLVHRCIYGIVHPDDHHELKVVLEHSLPDPRRPESQQSLYDVTSSDCPDYKKVQFLCRLKCFNGTSTGYVKMHCTGTMRSFPEVVKQSSRTSCQVLFAACQPFISLASDANIDVKNNVFGSKHEMDLKFKNVDDRVFDVAGYQPSQFEGKSFYEIIHLHDITAVFAWHKLLIDTSEINTMYFRMMKSDGSWVWLHTRGKVVYKNSRKFSIMMTHCPVREEDSSYLKQEALMRSRYAIEELVKSKCRPDNVEETDYLSCSSNYETLQGQWADDGPLSLQNSGGVCPSSYHQSADRHSPVFPSTYVYHRYQPRERSTTVRTKGLNTVTLQQHQMLQQQQQQQPGLQQCQYYGYSYEQIQQYAYMQTKETLPPQYGAHQRLSHLPMEYYNNNNNSYVQWSVQSQPEIKSEPLFTDFEKYRHLDQFSLTPQTSPDSSYNVQSSVVISQNLYPVTPLSPPPSPVTMTTGMCVQMPSPKPQCTVQGLRSNQLHHVDNYPNSSRKTVTPSQLNSAYTNCSSHQYIQNKYNGVRKTPVTLLNGDRNQSCRYNNLKHFHNSQTKYCQLAEDTSSQLPLNTNPAVEVDIVSNNPISDLHRASSLPPIGSFLDFLNEELIVPINT